MSDPREAYVHPSPSEKEEPSPTAALIAIGLVIVILFGLWRLSGSAERNAAVSREVRLHEANQEFEKAMRRLKDSTR